MGNGKEIKVSELERIAAEVSSALRDLMGGVQRTPTGWVLEDWEKTLDACTRLEGQADNLVQVLRTAARSQSWEDAPLGRRGTTELKTTRCSGCNVVGAKLKEHPHTSGSFCPSCYAKVDKALG